MATVTLTATTAGPCGCCGAGEDDLCVCGWQDSLCVTLTGLPYPHAFSLCDANGEYQCDPLFTPPSLAARTWQYLDENFCEPGCVGNHLFAVEVYCGGSDLSPADLAVRVILLCNALSLEWFLTADGLAAEDCESGITLTDPCTASPGGGDCSGVVSAEIAPGACGGLFVATAPGARAKAPPPAPCRFRGEALTGGERAALGLSHKREWVRCGLPGFARFGLPVTDCRTCGVKAEQRCGPTCPGYAAGEPD